MSTTPRPLVARLPAPAPAVLVVSGSVGAGHDGAARELADRLRAAGVHVDVRDYLDALPRWFAFALREGYTGSLRWAPALFDWLFLGVERKRWVRATALTSCRMGDAAVAGWLRERRYDAVVSTYPFASQSLGQLRATGQLAAPAVTYLTDPAVHRTWVHPQVDVHLTVTEASARQGQRTYGVAMQAAGPLVPDRFARPLPAGRRRQVRAGLGLSDDDEVALLVAGSLALGDVTSSVRDVRASGVVPVVLCGRNRALQEQLSRWDRVVALGWREDVHELMQAADVLVHNAGGLSFTEALVAGLPAVSYRCIPGHGAANAGVLDSAGLASWARGPRDLPGALATELTRGREARLLPDPADVVLALLPGRRREVA